MGRQYHLSNLLDFKPLALVVTSYPHREGLILVYSDVR